MLDKFKNKKGFTLMEMLIVVAITAILIAIAIPTFNGALNKARVGTDTANIRAGYASVMVEVLTEDVADNTTFGLNKDGTVTEGGTGSYQTQGKNETAVTIGGSVEVASWEKGKTITYTVSGGKVTAITPAA